METLNFFLTSVTGQLLLTLGKLGITVIAAWSLMRLLHRSLNAFAEKGFIHDQLGSLIHSMSKWLIICTSFFIMLGFLGVSTASLWIALSTLMVFVALGFFVAAWNVLSHVFCSVLLVVLAPFRVGDEIEIQDASSVVVIRGRVVGINAMFTTLRAVTDNPEKVFGEELIRVPNNLFFQKYIRCWPGKKTKTLQSYLAMQHHIIRGMQR